MADFLEHDGMPAAPALAGLLGEETSVLLAPLIGRALMAPARDLVRRPSKQFRARLVRAGFDVARGETGAPRSGDLERLALCAHAIELLHAGSLIVDDIQDGSPVRRGAPTLHLRYGMPGALCTGNWLYFWPLRILRGLGLSTAEENLAFRLYHDALEKAHYGQALDLGVRVDELPRERTRAVCDAVTDLKTGSVTALAMMLGAIVAGVAEERVLELGRFGRTFGAVLQRCDDLGNVLGHVDPEKRFEDLLLRKPSGVWSLAAAHGDATFFDAFRARAARLPEAADELVDWLEAEGVFERAWAEGRRELSAALDALAEEWALSCEQPGLVALRRLGEQVIDAYR